MNAHIYSGECCGALSLSGPLYRAVSVTEDNDLPVYQISFSVGLW